MSNPDECAELRQSALKALDEWIMWEGRSRLAPSLTPIHEKDPEPVYLTAEMIENFEIAREEREKAKQKHDELLAQLVDCIKAKQ